MAAMYKVTIDPAKKKNFFRVTWLNLDTNKRESFDMPDAGIIDQHIDWLGQKPKQQLALGEKIFAFLDGNDHHLKRALIEAENQGEILQIHLCACKKIADWPFELLASENKFLVFDSLHLVRCVSDWGAEKKTEPQERPLKLLFMACSAIDVQPELDFEKEEETIFDITEELSIYMEVEDSGSLGGLRERLEKEHFDVVHLSGHADIDNYGQPFFIMENETGSRRYVYPDELWQEALIDNPPRLLFLSGCRTGQSPKDGGDETAQATLSLSNNPLRSLSLPESRTGKPPKGKDDKTDKATLSFTRVMVEKYRIPAALGWGRSVNDLDATNAERALYYELSRGKSLLQAVHRARYKLSISPNPAWPLLRLFTGGEVLNSIIIEGQKRKVQHRRMAHIYLKKSKVKVLADGFVGRRRQLQRSLRTLKNDFDKVGLLIHGAVGLGKSCLAGKISERLSKHTLIIVHGRLDAITLEEALKDAFIIANDEMGSETLNAKLEMREKLGKLCASSFKENNYLLLFDDFEKNIEGAKKGQPGHLLSDTAEIMKALLHYLPFSGKMTRLIITSRYTFSLVEKGQDLVKEWLESIILTSFQKNEQLKKARELENIFNYPDKSIIGELLNTGHGNPHLMDLLDELVGEMAQEKVLKLVSAFKNKQEKFIRSHVLRELLFCGGYDLTVLLRRFAVYRLPVQIAGVYKIADIKAGCSQSDSLQDLLGRGIGLSLIEYDQARHSYKVTPLLHDELLQDLKDPELTSCHQAAYAYYEEICEAMEEPNPILVKEWIFHSFQCGREDMATYLGGRLVGKLGEYLAFRESELTGQLILTGKKQGLTNDDDAFLLNALGSTTDDLGDHHKAIEYYSQALTIWKNIHGENHQHVATALNNLGSVWHDLSEHDKAITYYEQALAIRKKIHGDKHEDVAVVLSNLGTVWQALGNYGKANDYFEQALKISRSIFGEGHPQVATVLNNIGEIWRRRGNLKKAISYIESALKIMKKVYPENHPDLSSVINNMGTLWDEFGDKKKAITYHEHSLNIDKNLFGDEHPAVASKLINLGSTWRALGEYNKARDYFEQALKILKKVYGAKHPEIATTLINMGGVWQDKGEIKKAISYYEQALLVERSLFDDKHPRIADGLNSLGAAWQDLGEHEKAIDYFEQALAINRSVYGDEHPDVAQCLNNIGLAVQALGKPKKTIQYLEQALEIWKKANGENNEKVALVLNNLGEALRTLGEPKKAINFYEQALAIDRSIFGFQHQKVAGELNNMGLAYHALGEHKKAIDYFEQALQIDRGLFGEEHMKVAKELNNLALAWQALGEFKIAINYYKQSLDIRQKLRGEHHQDVAHVLTNIGTIWKDLGEHKKAIDYYEQALKIDRTVFGEKHPNVSLKLNNLGISWRLLGKPKKAMDYFEQALAIDRDIFGSESPKVATRLNNLGGTLDDLGKHKKAIACHEQALKIWKKIYGEQNHNVAIGLNNLGESWRMLGKVKRALGYFEQALIILKKVYGEKHHNVAVATNNVGVGYLQLGEPKKAKGYFMQALKISQRIFGQDHPDVAQSLKNGGVAHFKMGEKKQAKSYFKKAYVIYNKFYGDEHPHTKELAEWLTY